MGIDDRRDGVSGIVKAIDELKAESDQKRIPVGGKLELLS